MFPGDLKEVVFCGKSAWTDQTPHSFSLTSDNTEKLLNPHVDVDPAEELVHVAPPLLQDGAGRLAGLQTGEAGIDGSTGYRYRAVFARLACKHFAQPAQHQLQPLLTQNR